MTPSESKEAEQLGLFKSTFTPGVWRVQPSPGGCVIIPNVSGSEHLNAGKIIAQLFGPDALANAQAFVDWHNAQQDQPEEEA